MGVGRGDHVCIGGGGAGEDWWGMVGRGRGGVEFFGRRVGRGWMSEFLTQTGKGESLVGRDVVG